jgi:hypothetical protein
MRLCYSNLSSIFLATVTEKVMLDIDRQKIIYFVTGKIHLFSIILIS